LFILQNSLAVEKDVKREGSAEDGIVSIKERGPAATVEGNGGFVVEETRPY
jgi:hypothetical protein